MIRAYPIRHLGILMPLFAFTSTAIAQRSPLTYSGAMEYSLPLLKAMPPISDSQPSDIANAYLWADQLMRTTSSADIETWLKNLINIDTMKFLAKMEYKVRDDNPLTLYQWESSGWPEWGHADYPWHYKADPGVEVDRLTNTCGYLMADTGRNGYLIACDIIADIRVSDTSITNVSNNPIAPHEVFIKSTVLDPIKGKQIPECLGYGMRARQGKITAQTTYATPWITHAVPDDTGSCLEFEYSPEWSRTKAGDQVPYANPFKDSSGWWVKPSGEYIVFLYFGGIGSDTSNAYFSVWPYWGVFGTQGGIYRVLDGIVQDPNDDFGLGAAAGLPVNQWKARLRARIYNILNP